MLGDVAGRQGHARCESLAKPLYSRGSTSHEGSQPVLSTLLVSVLNRTAWRYLNAVHPRVDVFKVHIYKSHSLKGSGSKPD